MSRATTITPLYPAHTTTSREVSGSLDTSATRRHERRARKLPTLALALLAVLALGAPSAHADSLNVNPTRLMLSTSSPTSLLHLQNLGKTGMGIQIEVVEWAQDAAGNDLESPTEDIVVYPTLFDLDAGATRSLRIGLLDPPPVVTEKTYRIYARQLPNPDEIQANTLAVMLRIGVPIFYLPSDVEHSIALEPSLTDCRARLRLANDGNVHLDPQDLTLVARDAGGAAIFTEDVRSWYLLADRSRELEVEIPEPLCPQVCSLATDLRSGRLELQAVSDDMCSGVRTTAASTSADDEPFFPPSLVRAAHQAFALARAPEPR